MDAGREWEQRTGAGTNRGVEIEISCPHRGWTKMEMGTADENGDGIEIEIVPAR